MKKILCITISIIMLLTLFGCTVKQPMVEAEPLGNAIVFFETDEDADCALITCNGYNILIDTGEKSDGRGIAKQLIKYGITSLDYVAFSHFDKDHCGGAIKVFEQIEVKNIIHPSYIKDSDEAKKLFEYINENQISHKAIEEKTELSLDELKLTVFPAEKSIYKEKESNNSSMVIKAEMLGFKALFAGDCQEERVEELLNSNEDFSADILKLMYHGREVQNEGEFLDRVKPKYTVITAENKKKNRENIERFKTKIGSYYFNDDGTIIFEIKDNQIIPTQED